MAPWCRHAVTAVATALHPFSIPVGLSRYSIKKQDEGNPRGDPDRVRVRSWTTNGCSRGGWCRRPQGLDELPMGGRVALLIEDVLTGAASAAPHRVALTLGEAALTFAHMREKSNRLANALAGWGLRRGDRVAYWADISLDAAPLQFALGRLGAAFAPLNPAYSVEEARVALDYLAPRLVVADRAHAEPAAALTGELDLALATYGRRGPGVALERLAESSSPSSPTAPVAEEEDVFTIFLTSGSTGRPKGVMISQRATWLRAHAGSTPTVTTGGKGQLVMFPLFHMSGWAFAYYAWSAHQPAHLIKRADAAELLGCSRTPPPGFPLLHSRRLATHTGPERALRNRQPGVGVDRDLPGRARSDRGHQSPVSVSAHDHQLWVDRGGPGAGPGRCRPLAQAGIGWLAGTGAQSEGGGGRRAVAGL